MLEEVAVPKLTFTLVPVVAPTNVAPPVIVQA
jgi:hypothetical protein